MGEAVHHNLAGLSLSSVVKLFMRQASHKLLKDLSTTQSLLIEGPPGTGKSSLVWYWVVRESQNQTVCWIHNDEAGLTVCWLKDSKIVHHGTGCNSEDIFKELNILPVDVLIVDGLGQDHTDLLAKTLAYSLKGHRIILVTSSQVNLKMETKDKSKLKTCSVPSWTLAEYKQALAHEDICAFLAGDNFPGTTEKRSKWIEAKHYLAGGSIQWMIAFPTPKVIEDIETYIAKASDASSIVKGLRGDRSVLAVNHLTMRDDQSPPQIFIASKYIARQLVERCDSSWIVAASQLPIAWDNLSFDGWLFEAEFMIRLRLGGGKIRLFESLDGAVEWEVKHRHRFFDLVELKNKQIETNDWLLPSRWNQGGYDAVCLLPDGVVCFVQITIESSHSVKLKFARQMLDLLAELKVVVKTVQLVYVVPVGNKFTPPTFRDGKLGKEHDKKLDKVAKMFSLHRMKTPLEKQTEIETETAQMPHKKPKLLEVVVECPCKGLGKCTCAKAKKSCVCGNCTCETSCGCVGCACFKLGKCSQKAK